MGVKEYVAENWDSLLIGGVGGAVAVGVVWPWALGKITDYLEKTIARGVSRGSLQRTQTNGGYTVHPRLYKALEDLASAFDEIKNKE